MKQYQQTADGGFTLDGKLGFPDSEGNRHYRQMMEEVEAGEAEILPYVEPAPTAEELADQGKRDGFMYGDTQVPVTNADAIGAMQIKMGFEDFGMTDANFHLSNGEVLPLTAAEWPAFAAQFFAERAKWF